MDEYRRLYSYLQTVFSIKGKLQVRRMTLIFDNEVSARNAYEEYQRITGSAITFDDFVIRARTLIQKYASRADLTNAFVPHSIIQKQPSNHHKWLKQQTPGSLEKTYKFATYNFVKEPKKKALDADLIPILEHLFDNGRNFFSISHGEYNVFDETDTFVVPDNMAIVFPKSLGFWTNFGHIHIVLQNMKKESIARQYCTNPLWGRGKSWTYDAFRNRVYAPPGSTVPNGYFHFTDEAHQTGIYHIYDQASGTKRMPDNTPYYVKDPDNGLNLNRGFFPHHAIPGKAHDLYPVKISEVVNRLSQSGGGVYVSLHCRIDSTERDYTFQSAKRREKSLTTMRRSAGNTVASVNLGGVYLRTNTPVIRKAGSKEDTAIGMDYARALLRMYHLGGSVSKKKLGLVHKDFRRDARGFIRFRRKPENTGSWESFAFHPSGMSLSAAPSPLLANAESETESENESESEENEVPNTSPETNQQEPKTEEPSQNETYGKAALFTAAAAGTAVLAGTAAMLLPEEEPQRRRR